MNSNQFETVENPDAESASARPVFKIYVGMALVLPEGTKYIHDYRGEPTGFILPSGKMIRPILGFEVCEDPNGSDDSFDVTSSTDIEQNLDGYIIDTLPPDIREDGVNSVDRVFVYSYGAACTPNPSRIAVLK